MEMLLALELSLAIPKKYHTYIREQANKKGLSITEYLILKNKASK
jgi:hypothetical protein